MADHLIVVLHVGSISIQRAISIKGDELEALVRSMHLHCKRASEYC